MKFAYAAILAILPALIAAETCPNVIAQADDTSTCTPPGGKAGPLGGPTDANLNPFCFSNGLRAGIIRPCFDPVDSQRTFAVPTASSSNGASPSCIHSCLDIGKNHCKNDNACLNLVNNETGACQSVCQSNCAASGALIAAAKAAASGSASKASPPPPAPPAAPATSTASAPQQCQAVFVTTFV